MAVWGTGGMEMRDGDARHGTCPFPSPQEHNPVQYTGSINQQPYPTPPLKPPPHTVHLHGTPPPLPRPGARILEGPATNNPSPSARLDLLTAISAAKRRQRILFYNALIPRGMGAGGGACLVRVRPSSQGV